MDEKRPKRGNRTIGGNVRGGGGSPEFLGGSCRKTSGVRILNTGFYGLVCKFKKTGNHGFKMERPGRPIAAPPRQNQGGCGRRIKRGDITVGPGGIQPLLGKRTIAAVLQYEL